MKNAASSVEFSFNKILYRQIDGVPIGSPLASASANIFVGFYEIKLFYYKSPMYHRYIDDPFVLFNDEKELLR